MLDSKNTDNVGRIKNRQKIFYQLSARNSDSSSSSDDSIIPPNLYTCPAEVSVDFENNADYIKCYSCESDAKSIGKCKQKPSANETLVIWCYSKTQKCFTKGVYNTTNKNELVMFSRGCATVSDMENGGGDSAESASATTTTTTTTKATKTGGAAAPVCSQKSSTTKTCHVMCDKHLCNTEEDLLSSGQRNNLKKSTLFFYLSIITTVIPTLIMKFY